MRGKLKDGDFFKGDGEGFSAPKGKIVEITDTENHSIYGKRYKIKGFDVWFERNCFDYIEGEESNEQEKK